MAISTRFSRSVKASPDINEPVATIKRDRTTRMAGALGGLALVTAGLLAMPFLDFRQGFDPGPAETAPAYQADRGMNDQASDTTPTNDAATNPQTEPTLLPPAEMPQQAADTTDMNDQGARGATDRNDTQAAAPDSQGSQGAPSSTDQQ